MRHVLLWALLAVTWSPAIAQAPAPAAPQIEVATESPGLAPPATSDEVSPIIVEPPIEVTAAGDASSDVADSDAIQTFQNATNEARDYLVNGGPAIWAIAALSIVTLALILWKVWRLALLGAWSKGRARRSVTWYEHGDRTKALAFVEGRRGIRSKVMTAALRSVSEMTEDRAREETARVAKGEIAAARSGLGALELISTIAPLLGLLGTVMGMIAAFQALQAAGSRADPALLAGGIWEALLTTAAGMAVAIPASAALTWFEAVIDRITRDIEDGVTRVFVANTPQDLEIAAQ